MTERLELREFTLDDAEAMVRLNDDPEVIRYTGDPPFASVEEARELLQELRDTYARVGFSRWATVRRDDGAFIGWCGLSLKPERDEVDIGFRFFRDQWGHGYATEAALASLHVGFERFGLAKIVGRAMRENGASHAVLTKLGMTATHIFEQDGERWTQYEIDAETWRKRI